MRRFDDDQADRKKQNSCPSEPDYLYRGLYSFDFGPRERSLTIHRWRLFRDFRIAKSRCAATIRCRAWPGIPAASSGRGAAGRALQIPRIMVCTPPGKLKHSRPLSHEQHDRSQQAQTGWNAWADHPHWLGRDRCRTTKNNSCKKCNPSLHSDSLGASSFPSTAAYNFRDRAHAFAEQGY